MAVMQRQPPRAPACHVSAPPSGCSLAMPAPERLEALHCCRARMAAATVRTGRPRAPPFPLTRSFRRARIRTDPACCDVGEMYCCPLKHIADVTRAHEFEQYRPSLKAERYVEIYGTTPE
jgi:hypothetical protein